MKTKPIKTPRNWKELKPHPLSELVEFGVGIDIDALAQHMQQHGYDADEAIILHEGQILDGRHKHAAAIKAEITPTFKQFRGKNAMAYAAKKIFRQHLNESQRAMMAATLTKVSNGQQQAQTCAPNPPTQEEAADVMNVSRGSVQHAKKVQEKGTPELNQAVADGTVSVSDAAKLADEPPEVQNEAVETVRKGQAATATAATKPLVLCERCDRVAPGVGVKGCSACKEARAAAKKNPPKPETNGKHEPPEPEEVKDAEGTPVPEHALEAFATAKDLTGICREIDGLTKRIEDIAKGPGGRCIRWDSVKQQLKDAKGNLWANRATHVCSYCHGKKGKKPCECCKDEGWVPKFIWHQAPGNNEKAKR